MNARTNISSPTADPLDHQAVYRRLWEGDGDADRLARDLLERALAETDLEQLDLPACPDRLEAWMRERHQRVGDQYRAYLDGRARGGPRRYFQCRAQALFFLRCIAPTKLVDGAWLHGLTRYWNDHRLRPLLRIHLEELGDGAPDRNHVIIYQRLLARYGCEARRDLDDDCFLQGALQLALGRRGGACLPEVIGFNLGYEQLPLHLLITAHELAELDIDPHYFTLHITIDNMDVGHARKACQSVLDMLSGTIDQERFYERVRRGYALNALGPDPATLVSRFDLAGELGRILQRKAETGRHMHPDHSRLGGRRLNDWLADLAAGQHGAGFLGMLQRHGWIRRGRPAAESRFWNLIEGENADMFGVFDGYEKQVLHDWIVDDGALPARRRYRGAPRPRSDEAERHGSMAPAPEIGALDRRLAALTAPEQRMALLAEHMTPARHFTPVGLHATRRFAHCLDRL